MTIKELADIIEAYAPLLLQEEYDNSGLNIGKWESEVKGVLLCVDVTEAVVEEAIALNANVIISHHPLLFHPLREITESDHVQRIAVRCIRNNIALYAAHTNLDGAPQGMSFALGSILGLLNMEVLHAHQSGLPNAGWGVVGELKQAITSEQFLWEVKKKLNCGAIRHTDLCLDNVQRIALSTGAGSSFLDDAIRANADVYLSSDFRYNDFFRPDGDLILADVGHFESEYCAIDLLYSIITNKLVTFAVHKSERSINPINYLV